MLTFVSDSLLGKWWLLPQQQTEKQADRQAHRGNPGIRAYNRRAPSAQSFYLLEGGATRVGRPERAGGMVTRVGVTPFSPYHLRKKNKKTRCLPQFYSGKYITWLSTERGRWWLREMFLSLNVFWGTPHTYGIFCPFTFYFKYQVCFDRYFHQPLKVMFELHCAHFIFYF